MVMYEISCRQGLQKQGLQKRGLQKQGLQKWKRSGDYRITASSVVPQGC
jgi:hypothetical protein